MKKSKLNADYEYDFGLLGISSTLKPHKIAWLFNQTFKMRLIRQADLTVLNKNNEPILYCQYLYETPLTTIRLFRNRAVEPETSKWMLVPEHSHCDYVLMLKSDDDELGNRLLKSIKDIPSIEWVAFLPLAALKSKDNFIF